MNASLIDNILIMHQYCSVLNKKPQCFVKDLQ